MQLLPLAALAALLPSLALANPVPPPPNAAILAARTSHPHPALHTIKRTYALTPAQLKAIDDALSAGHLGTSFADFAKKTGLDLGTVEKIFDVTGLASSAVASKSVSASVSASSKVMAPLSTSKAVSTVSAAATSKAVSSSSTSKAPVVSSTSKAPVVSSTSKPVLSSTSKPISSSAAPSTSKSSTSSAVASPSAAASSLTADQQQFLTLHNQFRAKYGAAPFTWNSTLATYAANTAKTCKYGHTYGPYGENIAAGVGGGYNIAKGFDTWAANEAVKYDYNNPGYADATGHFTQIVWKNSTQVGCAVQSCADGTIFTGYGQNSQYLVCEFMVPGNWVSSNSAMTARYFSDNVGRPV